MGSNRVKSTLLILKNAKKINSQPLDWTLKIALYKPKYKVKMYYDLVTFEGLYDKNVVF